MYRAPKKYRCVGGDVLVLPVIINYNTYRTGPSASSPQCTVYNINDTMGQDFNIAVFFLLFLALLRLKAPVLLGTGLHILQLMNNGHYHVTLI